MYATPLPFQRPLLKAFASLLAVSFIMSATSCSDDGAHDEPTDQELIDVPAVPADGPKLGAIADVAPIHARPEAGSALLGYLHAGALVTRAATPYSFDGCLGGWYPIHPRGFVCAANQATIDLKHPTLRENAIQPKLDAPLPYVYARTSRSTELLERNPDQVGTVEHAGDLRARSALAAVGSLQAEHRRTDKALTLMTNGMLVQTADLEPAKPSSFEGVKLGTELSLPVAWVVKPNVSAWHVAAGKATKREPLGYHERLELTGRYRTAGRIKAWAVKDGRYVRHRDVTVVRRRHVFPDCAQPGQRWIDVSVVMGPMVLYEGKKPVYATLVSVGRDRLSETEGGAVTKLGTFKVVCKHINVQQLDPHSPAEYFHVYDLPWTLELSSKQLLHAAIWHDRFGLESGPGNVQLSPADAAFVWRWAGPELPRGWHGVRTSDSPTIVVIRK